jgi:hypothetical protein
MRHVVVEKPDGSVAIAINEDVPVPPPPPPPEEVISEQQQTVVRYSPINAVTADFLVFLAIGVMMMYQRYVDAFNIIFGLMTCHALHRKPVPYRFTGPSLLGAQSYAFIMCTFFTVTHMWWEAAYQFSCGTNILFTFLYAEEIEETLQN